MAFTMKLDDTTEKNYGQSRDDADYRFGLVDSSLVG